MNNQEKIKISNFGIALAIAGIISIPLKFMPINLYVLNWIDFFGETVGWLIRVALIAIGLTLYFNYDVADDELSLDEEEDKTI